MHTLPTTETRTNAGSHSPRPDALAIFPGPGVRTLHWAEYAIEAGSLAVFMASATLATTLLEYHASPVRHALADATIRRGVVGLLMGLTAVAIIYSGPGRRSGAHMNPATTLAFLWCGKIAPVDAAFYVAAQFLGGFLGMAAMVLFPWAHADDPAVNYIVTIASR